MTAIQISFLLDNLALKFAFQHRFLSSFRSASLSIGQERACAALLGTMVLLVLLPRLN